MAHSTGEMMDAAQMKMEASGPPPGSVTPASSWCAARPFVMRRLFDSALGRRVQKDVWNLDDERKGLPFLRLQVLLNKTTLADFPFRLKWGVDMQRGACKGRATRARCG